MQSQAAPGRWRDILLLIFSITGILGLLARGIFVAVTGFASSGTVAPDNKATGLLGLLGMIFCAALLLPMLIYSLRRLKGREIPPARLPAIKLWQVVVLVVAWLLCLGTGTLINGLVSYGWIIAAPFFVISIALPVAALTWIAAGRLTVASWQRLWSAFGIGLAGSTFAAILLEYLVVGVGVVMAGIAAIINPAWQTALTQIRDQITNAGDIQSLLTALAPYLTSPLVLLVFLVFAAVIAPVIEESLKPLAVWLMGKRLASPAEGFALGALCGAGFALLEGMTAASGVVGGLGIGLAARAASSLMHITATGLSGWGIASARAGKMLVPKKRYGRLVGALLMAVTLHGLWNGSVVLAIYGALRTTLNSVAPDLLGVLSMLLGAGILLVMLVAILILLPVINLNLRHVQPVQDDIISPLSS